MAGGAVIVEVEGLEGLSVLNVAVAAEFGGVGVEGEAVGSGGNVDGIVGERFLGVEVEAEGEAVVFVGHEFVAFVDEPLLYGFTADDAALADEVDHGLVKVGEAVEFKIGVVAQAPLAAGILV